MEIHEMNDNQPTTHFGYKEVLSADKAQLVGKVFHSVAPKYDLMNDIMSLGLHRLWKRFAISEAQARPGQVILDVAAGTGDLTKIFAKQVGDHGQVFMTDINEAMLQAGRDRLIDAGIMGCVTYVQANAEHLPFAEDYFDCVTIAFGLRNVTNKDAALSSMYRVLKPGGKLLILEFSHPPLAMIKQLYDLYSFKLIPKMGELIAKDRESYQYLVESIRKHPDQDAMANMMLTAQFEDVTYTNLSGGIVALHKGYKY
jgi:demethylmenaquinone methyltransferase/2-methoxy-6-polyprenyl-1,4-benzoquinol methylase